VSVFEANGSHYNAKRKLMALYFKFHSLADIQEANDRLGLNLRFTDDLTPLFFPANVGPFRVGNRLCILPMEGCDGTADGSPDELTLRRYQRFGGGGAKIIWGEAAAVMEEGRANPRQLWLHEENADSFNQIVDVCRQSHRQAFGTCDDLLIGLQLTHSGRYSYRRPLIATHDSLLDPRTFVDKKTGTTVDSDYPLLTDEYLKRLVDRYVTATRLAYQAGFQFVDLKQCHRYLLNELLSARRRPGVYGGSFENRTRLAREIIAGIRSEVPKMMIATRLNVFDGLPFRKGPHDEVGEPCPGKSANAWGSNLDDPMQPDLYEPIQWTADMIQMGVTLINVTMGNPYASPHLLRPFEHAPPDGYLPPEHPLVSVNRHFSLTEIVQRKFPDASVIGSGYSYLQQFLFNAGAANIRDGRATFVGVGRASLAQPDFAKQLLEQGKLDRKRICRTFSYCTALMRAKHNELGQYATGCPPFDKEVYGPIWKESKGPE
jgi:2,4-dienoyl-CoA reductase-like NADH-dependent reductase (Old Yellow Enzyme family)